MVTIVTMVTMVTMVTIVTPNFITALICLEFEVRCAFVVEELFSDLRGSKSGYFPQPT